MKISYLIISSLLLILIACGKPSTSQTASTNKEIVLCFDHYDPKPYKTPGGASHISMPKVAYIDNTEKFVDYMPNTDMDTIAIKCPDEFKEIALSYRNFEYTYYPILQGDTVLISMDSLDYPILRSKHHPERNRIYNMNYELRKGHTFSGLEAKTCLGNDWLVRISRNIQQIRALKFKTLIKDYYPLDSLQNMFDKYKEAYIDTINLFKNQQLISRNIYRHYQYLLQLKEYEAQRILNKDSSFYHKMEPEILDQYACFPSYYEYLNYYLWYYNYHIKLIKVRQGSYYDWRQTFDDLCSEPFQQRSIQILLKSCIPNIGENFSAGDVTHYLNKYIEKTKDSTFYKEIISQYNLSATPNQLLLRDIKGHQTTFQELLNKYKGKVIYVDFWASWCEPCKKEMKPAARLRKKYKEKNIVFVYLGYRDTESDWIEVSKKEGLSELKNNFFILNSKNSKMLEKIKLSLIPRFLIFNRSGKLVEMNAPRPSSKQVEKNLNKYL